MSKLHLQITDTDLRAQAFVHLCCADGCDDAGVRRHHIAIKHLAAENLLRRKARALLAELRRVDPDNELAKKMGVIE